MTSEITPKPNVEISLNPANDRLQIALDIQDFLEAPDEDWLNLRVNIRNHLVDKKIIEYVKQDNDD